MNNVPESKPTWVGIKQGRDLFLHLVQEMGGTVQDGVVLEPGVGLVEVSRPTPLGHSILSQMGARRIEEAATAITYWSFPVRPGLVADVLDKGHWSVLGHRTVTFLIVGASLEAILEVVSHGTPVSRLTSSRCAFQADPVFVGTSGEVSAPLQREIGESRDQFHDRMEAAYRCYGGKAGACFVTFTERQLRHIAVSRTQIEGNEQEVRNLFARMLDEFEAAISWTPSEGP